MASHKVSIPKPCSFGWDNMIITSDRKGKHCKACDKIVVDFTAMTTIELQDFLLNYQGVKICGHFKTIQTTTTTTWYQRLLLNFHNYIDTNYRKTLLKRLTLFAICALLGLAGCSTTTTTDGDIAPRESCKTGSIVADSLAKSLDLDDASIESENNQSR